MHPQAEARQDATDDEARVRSQVGDVFAAYERALAGHDVVALDAFFHPSPQTRRFGVADEQQGADAVRRWRRADPGVPPGRRLEATQVQVLSPDVAVVTTRFGYGARPATGRQTQVWLRTDAGWRIASAHVSEPSPGS
jgi:ketosteroid isomerase-like protein